MPAWGSRSKDRAIGSAVAPPTIDPLLPAAMPSPPPLRSRSAGAPRWFAALVAGMLLLAGVVMPHPVGAAPDPAAPAAVSPAVATPRSAAPSPSRQPPIRRYRCDDEPLTAQLFSGAVDDPSLPDPSSGPVPIGGFVVLRWRDLSLQLPRTNNAGPASFTDGKWWWSLEDQDHPRFRLRQGLGQVQDFACRAADA